MPVRVEPLKVTGMNEFGKTLVTGAGMPVECMSMENIEETLRSMPKAGLYGVATELSIPLQATVVREAPMRFIVRLVSGEKSVELTRHTMHQPDGDISASCEPSETASPADSLNIHFRDKKHMDDLTDRGLVWVIPGNPATMHFAINAKALETPGKVAELVAEAEEAVRAKVLVHFQERPQ